MDTKKAFTTSKSSASFSTRKRFSAKSSYLASSSARKRTSAKSFVVAAKSSKKKTVSPKKAAAVNKRSKAQQKSFDGCDENKFMLLPDEIKLEVLKNLSPQDLRAVAATCHYLHLLIKDPSLWTLSVDISESRRSIIWKVEKNPHIKTLIIKSKDGLFNHNRFEDVPWDSRTLNKFRNLPRRVPHFGLGYYMTFDRIKKCITVQKKAT